jgi:radical SAM superfamily enzyme YgiQ (UPF0313 family)
VALKILLINVNSYSHPYPVFPLGISYLSSSLTAAGYKTHLYDLQADLKTIEEVLKDFNPEYIGLSLRNIDDVLIQKRTFLASELINHVQLIRSITKVPIIIGGSGFSIFPQKILELTDADFGIRGEGEIVFPYFLNCLETGKNYENIPGLVFRKNGIIISNPPKPEIHSVKFSNSKSHHLIKFYRDKSTILNFQTQRGCAFKCCYCTYPIIEGNYFRPRDPTDVCEEIDELVSFDVPYLSIVDSIFNSSVEHVTAVCEEILRRKLKIKWSCYLRPKGITQSLVNLMKEAGLSHIEFGSDSFCDTVLNKYNKHFTFSDINHASRCAKKAGVHYAHFLIFGGPGETEETINEGFKNSLFLKNTVFFSYVGMRVYPDTPLFHHMIKKGMISSITDILKPCYYITPDIPKEKILKIITEFGDQNKNWIIGEFPPKLKKFREKLINNGFSGPLWEYIKR